MVSRQICLYCARIYDRNEDLNIYADFENKIIFTFDKTAQLTYKDNADLFIYKLGITLKEGLDGQFQIQYDEGWKPVKKFTIQGSRRVLKIGSITYYEKHNREHMLEKYVTKKHNFLLDVQFDSKLKSEIPGMIVFHLNKSIFEYLI